MKYGLAHGATTEVYMDGKFNLTRVIYTRVPGIRHRHSRIGIDRNLNFRLRPYRTVSSPRIRPYTVPYRTVGYGQKTV